MFKFMSCLVLCLSINTAFANPVINSKTRHYEFNAESREQIWQHIRSAGDHVELNNGTDHQVAVAWTSYQLKLKYRYRAGLYQCRLEQYTPMLDVTITLPHWKDKWKADEVLAKNWDNYVRMVSQHENVHKEHAIKMAKEFDKRLAEIGITDSCRELKETIEKVKAEVIGQARADNKWFDAKEQVYQKKLRWF